MLFFLFALGGGLGGEGYVRRIGGDDMFVCFFVFVCFVFRGFGVEDFLRGRRWFFGRMNNSIAP